MQTKKRKMKIGEAFVGMKRRGSQLDGRQYSIQLGVMVEMVSLHTFVSKTSFLSETLSGSLATMRSSGRIRTEKMEVQFEE